MIAALEGGECSAAGPGRKLPPGKTRYPLIQEAGWDPGPVWTGGKSLPYQDSIPDRPARIQSLYRLSYPADSEYGGRELNMKCSYFYCISVTPINIKNLEQKMH